ncbi:MAG: hypothetical protein Q9157_008680, partial [Trypethelium eluteriae]
TVEATPPMREEGEMARRMDEGFLRNEDALGKARWSAGSGSGSARGRPQSTATVEERQKPLPAVPAPVIAESYTKSPSPVPAPTRFRKSGDFEDMEMRVQRVDSDSPPAH